MLHFRTGQPTGTVMMYTTTASGAVEVGQPHRQTRIYTLVRRAGYRTTQRTVAMAMGARVRIGPKHSTLTRDKLVLCGRGLCDDWAHDTGDLRNQVLLLGRHNTLEIKNLG